ncbi:PDC sensor domain-containing protein [Vreelandella maris]|uniref:PDC sensor domain-containing protein n=1 Tax=Vreelandella maris TaxID=2729617 RepID=UPI001FE68043|nr:cache domain-containing protein [Halomonas maris]
MFSTLRARILLAALVVITLALMINGIASYTTVKHHNNQQITRNISAVVKGNTQAINEWFSARYTMLSSMEDAVNSDDPLAALRQLESSGNFMSTYIAHPSTSAAIFSDGWEPPSDYDPRQRPWYQDAVSAGETIITTPYVDAQSGGLIVTFARPYYQNEKLAAVVGADIAITDVIEIVSGIAPTDASFGFLTTNDGTLVAHPDANLTLAWISHSTSASTALRL